MTNTRYRNSYTDGCAHFCTATVFGFLPLLADDETRRAVVRAWVHCTRRYAVELMGYVVMPEHIHLVVLGPAEAAEKFLQYSLQRSSRHLREILEARVRRGDGKAAEMLAAIRANGRVWKERARSVALDEEESVVMKLEYIHNNPVKRGLAAEPGQWRWSSWQAYETGSSVLAAAEALAGMAAGIDAGGERHK